jgi:hypothetical protein
MDESYHMLGRERERERDLERRAWPAEHRPTEPIAAR